MIRVPKTNHPAITSSKPFFVTKQSISSIAKQEPHELRIKGLDSTYIKFQQQGSSNSSNYPKIKEYNPIVGANSINKVPQSAIKKTIRLTTPTKQRSEECHSSGNQSRPESSSYVIKRQISISKKQTKNLEESPTDQAKNTCELPADHFSIEEFNETKNNSHTFEQKLKIYFRKIKKIKTPKNKTEVEALDELQEPSL